MQRRTHTAMVLSYSQPHSDFRVPAARLSVILYVGRRYSGASSQAANSTRATDVVGPATGAGELSQPNQRFSMAGQWSKHTTTPAHTTTLAKCASSGKLASLSTH